MMVSSVRIVWSVADAMKELHILIWMEYVKNVDTAKNVISAHQILN